MEIPNARDKHNTPVLRRPLFIYREQYGRDKNP